MISMSCKLHVRINVKLITANDDLQNQIIIFLTLHSKQANKTLTGNWFVFGKYM